VRDSRRSDKSHDALLSLRTSCYTCGVVVRCKFLPWRDRRLALVALSFGLTSSLIQPFFSNQNTYLLHAAGHSGRYPSLETDWLLNTIDPVPVFTGLVTPILEYGGLGGLIAFNAVVGVLFLIGLVECGTRLARSRIPLDERWRVAATVAGAWLVCPTTWRMAIFEGVAEQYVYRGFLQPSNAGVALVWAVATCYSGYPRVAALLGGLAILLHGTYLVPFACIAVGFLLCPTSSKRRRLEGLGLSVAIATAVLGYSAYCFAPTDAETFQEATRILVNERIPHHANPRVWMRPLVLIQGGLFLLGVWLCERRFARPLLVTAGLGCCLTVAVVALPTMRSLALAFPWRVFSVLVPIASTVILTHLVHVGSSRARGFGVVVIVAFFTVTGVKLLTGIRSLGSPPAESVALARILSSQWWTNDQHGTTCLVDPDWDKVRLNGEIPIFVDHKSHPYRDVEIIQWWRRLHLARGFYSGSEEDRCHVLSEILAEDPTVRWILTPPGVGVACPGVELLKHDDRGEIYRISSEMVHRESGAGSS